MKKTLLFTLLAVVIIAAISAFAFAANDRDELEWVEVTFNVEFTTPVDMLDGYGILFGNMSFTESFIKGDVVHSDHLYLMCLGDAVFEGWDKDLDTYVLNENTTFTATINNDGCVPAYFKTLNENGDPVGAMMGLSITEPDIYEGDFSHLVSFIKKGEKIEEGKNIPKLRTLDMEEYVYDSEASSFYPEPVGYEMNVPTEFVCTLKKIKPEDAHKYTITYKAEFTTPVDLPEGYSVLQWDSITCWPGSPIPDAPKPRFLGNAMSFVGWDVNPDDGQLIAAGDMTFTAKFNNDDCIFVYYKSVDEDGKPIRALLDPKTNTGNTLIAAVKKGEKLASSTIPVITSTLTYTQGSSWDEEPMGYMVNEPHEFTYTYKYYYQVRFIAEQVYMDEVQYVHRGEAAKAPDIPETSGWLLIKWDKDFGKVTEDMTVTATLYRFGDCNMDDVVNTADAVAILKHCAGMKLLTDTPLRLADANIDKSVNTTDAVKVLKIAAGMN